MNEETREQQLHNVLATLPKPELLYELSELFKIFGDSTRIQILSLLLRAELCVGEISSLLNLSPSAISHQLRILRQARLKEQLLSQATAPVFSIILFQTNLTS